MSEITEAMLEEQTGRSMVEKFYPGEPYAARLTTHVAGAIARDLSDELYLAIPVAPSNGMSPQVHVIHKAPPHTNKQYVVHTAVVQPDGRVTFLSGDYTNNFEDAAKYCLHRIGVVVSI